MNEDLKRHPDKALYHFIKVYVYHTNTIQPWDKLSPKDMGKKTFRWSVTKWFFISKTPTLTKKDIEGHIQNCPELKESIDDLASKNISPTASWRTISHYYHIYPSIPLKDEGEYKLLVNTIGLRMLHHV